MAQDLRERVARAIARKNGITLHDAGEASERHLWLDDADAAIAAVIEALAAEAEAKAKYFSEHRYDDPNTKWREAFDKEHVFRDTAEWLRAHIGGTEATE